MNIYTDPEKFGLKIVGYLNEGGGYDYAMFVIWTDGKHLFWADESGGSCPSPFEYTRINDLATGSKDALYRGIDLWETYGRNNNVARVALKDKIRAWKPPSQIRT